MLDSLHKLSYTLTSSLLAAATTMITATKGNLLLDLSLLFAYVIGYNVAGYFDQEIQ